MQQQKLTLSDTQAAVLATAFRPFIRDYIDAHRKEYEEFLARWELDARKRAEDDI